MRVSIESTDWPAAIAYSFCVGFNRKSRHFVLFVWIEPENLVIKLCKCFRCLVFGAVFCRYFLASFLLKIETYITLVFMIKIFTFFYLSSLLAVCLNLALRGRVSVSLQTLVFCLEYIFIFRNEMFAGWFQWRSLGFCLCKSEYFLAQRRNEKSFISLLFSVVFSEFIIGGLVRARACESFIFMRSLGIQHSTKRTTF